MAFSTRPIPPPAIPHEAHAATCPFHTRQPTKSAQRMHPKRILKSNFVHLMMGHVHSQILAGHAQRDS